MRINPARVRRDLNHHCREIGSKTVIDADLETKTVIEADLGDLDCWCDELRLRRAESSCRPVDGERTAMHAFLVEIVMDAFTGLS